MAADEQHTWTDNPTEAGVADCDPDILNDCLMFLRYNAATGNGIPPMQVKHREIKKEGKKYTLTWQDPEDSVIDGVELCTWGGTKIIRKAGSFPLDVLDGVEVLNSLERNKYAVDGFVDTVDNEATQYFYRAFPYSVNKVYNNNPLNIFGAWLYGYCEYDNESVPNERYTYLEENKGYKPCYMDFSRDAFNWGSWKDCPLISWNNMRPCMLYNESSGNNGKVAYYLNPNDFTKMYNSDLASDVKNTNFAGNAMVEVRKVFTKVVNTEDISGRKTYVYFSNVKLDDGFECFPCKRADGTYNEFFYVPIYNGSIVNNVLRSISGATIMSSKNAQQEIDYAKKNGAGWDTEVKADIDYFIHLFKLLFKSSDSQSVLGEGKSNGGSGAGDCLRPGTMDTKGMMFGSSSNAVGVKFCYMENFYASQWRRYRGHIVKNGKHFVKMTKSKIDGSGVDDYNTTGDGYIEIKEVPAASGSSGGYISKSQEVSKYGRFGTVISGSSSTYLCDGTWFNNSGVIYPYRGGDSNNGRSCGVSCFHSSNAASHANWTVGAALSFKPL